MILTFRFRVKDKNRLKQLRTNAWKVNRIWNYCVEYHRSCVNFWPSHFDLVKATQALGKEIDIHSDTRNLVCKQFVISRNTHKKCPKFRKSSGSKRSLGWTPFIRRAVRLCNDSITYKKVTYRFWKHREFPQKFRSGAFVEDSTGKWFITFSADVSNLQQAPDVCVGIDLGLKTLATLSNGEKLEIQQVYRRWEQKLAIAQRAGNQKRVKAIHAKIKNIRKHFNHVASARIARKFRTVVVGDVSSSKLAKTRMAKSVLDAGWYQLKSFLAYKVSRRQGMFKVVNEAYSSQTCSSCGCLPHGRPKGITGLGVRSWRCSACGKMLDRDINAAKNILSFGLEHQPPAEESPCL